MHDRRSLRSQLLLAALAVLALLASAGTLAWQHSRRRTLARDSIELVDDASPERDVRLNIEELNTLAMNEHRVKTSLSAAAGWADLLANEELSLDDATKQHAAERVSTIINRAISTINRDIGLLGEHQLPAEDGRSSADTAQLLPLSLKAFGAAASGGIELDAAPGLIADCPPGIYRQIIDQLLENAAKYSPPGHPVRVATRREDGTIITSVSDEGPGLPVGIDIFEPYVRAVPAGATEGSGLGLHIVRTLVERYGGSASARSNDTIGSTFEVRLPAASDDMRLQ